MREDEALDIQAGETLEGGAGLLWIRGEGRRAEGERFPDVSDGVPDQQQGVRLVEQAEMTGRVPWGPEDQQIAQTIAFRERFESAAIEADLGEIGPPSPHDRLRGMLRDLIQATNVVEWACVSTMSLTSDHVAPT
jgi:hypothetical protein